MAVMAPQWQLERIKVSVAAMLSCVLCKAGVNVRRSLAVNKRRLGVCQIRDSRVQKFRVELDYVGD